MHNFAAHLMLDHAAKRPERIAFRCQGRTLTHAELSRLSLAMAGLLRARGLAPGDRALIVLPESFSFVVAFLGCLLAGIVAAPLNTRLRSEDYVEIVESVRPALALVFPGHDAVGTIETKGVPLLLLDDAVLADLLADVMAASPHPAAADEVCVLFVTSGTTGHPKLVPHTYEHFSVVGKSHGDYYALCPDDIILSSGKMFHVYGLITSIILPLYTGAVALLDPGKPSAARTLEFIGNEGVTFLASTPVIYAMMLMLLESVRPPRLPRICLSAGEGLPAAIFSAWAGLTGQEIWQGYGATESMCFVVASRPPGIEPGSAGRVMPPYEVVILDQDLRPVTPGVPGQLAMRGPSIMSGYLDAPEWTSRAFTPDGFLLSGDMAVQKEGTFTILGRLNDMFKAGGLWIAPGRVENALLTHPGVAQCAVVGGSAGAFTLVRAFVVAKPGWPGGPQMAADLRRHAGERLADFMVPADIEFREDLPRTASGKVQRFKLK